MSHANGTVTFGDGLVMHYEYNGTSDVCISHLYESNEEMWQHWRKGEWLYCNCGKDEPAKIGTDYGSGSTMEGRACRHCKAITKDPYAEDAWPGWL